MRLTIIGIHGVGHSEPGRVQSSIVEALQNAADVDVREVYWSQVLDPDGEYLLNADLLGRLTRSVVAAGSRGFTYEAWRASASPARNVLRLIDAVLFAALVCGALLAPAVLLLLAFLALAQWADKLLFVSALVRDIPVLWIFWMGILSGGVFVSGVTSQLLEQPRLTRALVMSARRIVLTVAGPMVGSCFAPLSGTWALGLTQAILTLSTLLAITGPIVVTVVTTYFRYTNLDKGELDKFSISLFPGLLYPVGVALLVMAALYGLYLLLRPVFKVIADALIYLGHTDHKQSLVRGVAEDIDVEAAPSMPENATIVVGHSLGSVIAVDALRIRLASLNGPVMLVTLGSPLHRWFARFFPDDYPTPSQLLAEFRERNHRFFWHNIYRPLDPIGTRLYLQDERYSAEATTAEYRWKQFFTGSVLAQHLDYFTDRRARELAQRCVSRWLTQAAPLSSPGRIGSSLATETTPHTDPAVELMTLIKRASVAVWLLGAGFFAWLAWAQLPALNARAVDDRIAAIETNGVRLDDGYLELTESATFRLPWSYTPIGRVSYFAAVTFTPNDRKQPVSPQPLGADARTLWKFAEMNGVERARPNLRRAAIPAVAVVYDPKDPRRCYLPHFRVDYWTAQDRQGQSFWSFAILLFVWTMLLIRASGVWTVRNATPPVPPPGAHGSKRLRRSRAPTHEPT